jgi:hypothetical protein
MVEGESGEKERRIVRRDCLGTEGWTKRFHVFFGVLRYYERCYNNAINFPRKTFLQSYHKLAAGCTACWLASGS